MRGPAGVVFRSSGWKKTKLGTNSCNLLLLTGYNYRLNLLHSESRNCKLNLHTQNVSAPGKFPGCELVVTYSTNRRANGSSIGVSKIWLRSEDDYHNKWAPTIYVGKNMFSL